MTTPENYVPRDLSGGVAAMFHRSWGDEQNTQAVMDWVLSHMSSEATSSFDGYSSFWAQDGDFVLEVPGEHYVFLDEDGLHAVAKGAFEMALKKAPNGV